MGRVGTIKQVGKTLRVSICANYPFKDDKGQRKDDAHWNEVTIFTKAIQSYVSEHVSKGDLVHVRGRLRQNSFERDGQRVYTVDLIALELGRLAAGQRTRRGIANTEEASASPPLLPEGRRLTRIRSATKEVFAIVSAARDRGRPDFSCRSRTLARRS